MPFIALSVIKFKHLKNSNIMNKLKLEKIKLQDLSPEQQKSINGGDKNNTSLTVTTSIVPITIGILTETITEASKTMCNVSCDNNCVSNNPGTQNSCGLCQSQAYTNCH